MNSSKNANQKSKIIKKNYHKNQNTRKTLPQIPK